MATTKFINRMPANDDDKTIAYGLDDKVMHQVRRTAEGDKDGYPDQIAFEDGEAKNLTDPEPANPTEVRDGHE